MRCRVIVVLVCLAIGLIANVGFAIVAAVKVGSLSLVANMRTSAEVLPVTIGWPGPVPTDWPSDAGVFERAARNELTGQPGSGWTHTWVRSRGRSCEDFSLREPISTSVWYHYRIHRFGFPFQALRRDTLVESDMNPAAWPSFDEVPVAGVLGGLGPSVRSDAWARTDRLVPVVPVALGFAGNTLAYGALAWLVWFAVRKIRGRYRLKPGQCFVCRYQVNDLAICPECGTPVATPLPGAAGSPLALGRRGRG